ncbi:Imm26 family immunity protein [Kangiella sp. HZ709]|uniref:Imm26 family immunity protein n=1 Tax=Kangiella sp. HZ709 TaxID=2666328 RepID=UPI0012AFC78B|nr:Imm26 family immunity protein [Kangiella sp. HZ709]MRX27279.1 hypothetical protein [Kangiella sp. HZ709]
MKRQRKIPGMIVEIILEDNAYSYAQVLEDSMAFFALKSEKPLKKNDLLKLNDSELAFFTTVYDDVITKGHWLKVGKLDIRDDFLELPMKFIQDSISGDFELYNPNTGDITSSTYEECKYLECAAVWEAEHVEDRLRDYFNNTPNKWVESLKPIAP